MNFSITPEELTQYKHINFSVDLDSAGMSISDSPKDVVPTSNIQIPDGNLLTDLNHLSWGEVSNIGRSGTARQRIALGAVKTDHMKNGFNAEYRVIGFNHDDLADGSGKAPLSWEMTRAYKDMRFMNQESTNDGGWNHCYLRKWLNSEFLSICSDELRSVIRPVTKLTSAGGKSLEIVESADNIFIISEKELFGRSIYSAPGEGHWYEYYKQEDVPYFATDEDLEYCLLCWLRSPNRTNYEYFCNVHTSGSADNTIANLPMGLLVGFSL